MKQIRDGDPRRDSTGAHRIIGWESPPVGPAEEPHDLVSLSQLRSSAEEPRAPEAEGVVAELQIWDEPVDESGRRVGAPVEDEPTVGENLVQQGLNEADAEVRVLVADAERAHLLDAR